MYFGCLNDRFGGCGGVMNIHADPGVDRSYPVYGGLFREEAIMLLRRFYVQENEKGMYQSFARRDRCANVGIAPDPKPKKNRELKTEILPVTVTPVPVSQNATPIDTPPIETATVPVPTPVLGAQEVKVTK